MRVVSLVGCAVLVAALAAAAQLSIGGRIVDEQGLSLPGVAVTLVRPDGTTVAAHTSDEDGAFSFDVAPGTYAVHAELTGFEPVNRPKIVAGSQPIALTITMRLASYREQVTVAADTEAVVGAAQPNAPVAVTRTVLDNGMLPNSQYDDVLPLLPNVVRGPDGLISVGGARAPEGALVVDGINTTDPTAGGPGLLLPIEAVDSIDVFAGGYPADLGLATGGVTSVHMRSGADSFHATASSFFPRLRFIDGALRGVDSWEPNVGASGPIVRDRLYFEQALSYRFDRNRFGTLVGPQDNTFDALLSWSQLDYRLTPSHDVALSGGFDTQATDHWNITAFTPADTVPRLARREWSVSLSDRRTSNRGSALELHAAIVHTGENVAGDSALPYRVAHDLTTGGYFNDQDRQGARIEAGGAWTWLPSAAHIVKVGARVDRAALVGVDAAAPVDLLFSDGSVARTIDFGPAAALRASQIETGAFVQDAWSVSNGFTLDSGVRIDRASAAVRPRVSPRLAWTWKLAGDTTVGGNVGLFANTLPLAALTYPQLPARIEQLAGGDEVVSGSGSAALDLPYAARWDLELNRRMSDRLTLRVRYQERRGSDELVVDPVQSDDGRRVLWLSSSGQSTTRSIEATAGYRVPGGGNEVYVSYVRSRASGNFNSFDAVEGILREPFVQADAMAPLRADVPNRLLAWGLLRLPGRFTVAPFIEARSGFPYSAVADDWTYVGPRNGYRLPWFGSLDLYVNKIVGLPLGLPNARLGIKLYDLAAVHSERDVQRDSTRPDFGTAYNPIPRDFTAVFELLWGRK